MKSKNKLVPRLLGITKESVMRVDERTKDVVQEWPLTTVKRWAASPKSFTLVRDVNTHACVCVDQSDPAALSLRVDVCRTSGSTRRATTPFRPPKGSRFPSSSPVTSTSS